MQHVAKGSLLVCIGDNLDGKEGHAHVALASPVNHLGRVHCPPEYTNKFMIQTFCAAYRAMFPMCTAAMHNIISICLSYRYNTQRNQ